MSVWVCESVSMWVYSTDIKTGPIPTYTPESHNRRKEKFFNCFGTLLWSTEFLPKKIIKKDHQASVWPVFKRNRRATECSGCFWNSPMLSAHWALIHTNWFWAERRMQSLGLRCKGSHVLLKEPLIKTILYVVWYIGSIFSPHSACPPPVCSILCSNLGWTLGVKSG